MKYLEYTPFDRINDFIRQVNLGERTIKGCLEAYSCKHTGTDKRLSLSLENDIADNLGKSADADSFLPVDYEYGPSQKTLTYLLLTLYHMYPDYDFSAVKAYQFFTVETWESFGQIFDTDMSEASKEWLVMNPWGPSLRETLYKVLDEVVNQTECEIFRYNPTSDANPFVDSVSIWSNHFFFYNKKLKRVVSFRFSCLSNLGGGEGFVADDGEDHEYNEDIFDSMDI